MAEIVQPATNGKAPRRRARRAEHVNVNIDRVEHLLLEVKVKDAAGLSLLLNGIENRLAQAEDDIAAARAAPLRSGVAALREAMANGRVEVPTARVDESDRHLA
jgi:hypothetical protein